MTEETKTEGKPVEGTPQPEPEQTPSAPSEIKEVLAEETKPVDHFAGFENPPEEEPASEPAKPAEGETPPAEPPAEEPAKEPTGETPPTEEKAEEEETPSKEEEPEPPAEPIKEAKKPSTVQERIDDLTAKQREAEREAVYWKNKALQGEPPKAPVIEGEKPATVIPPAEDDPEPVAKDFEFGETDPKFVAAVAKHASRQEYKKLDLARTAKTAADTIKEKWETQLAAAKEKYPDYQQKVIDGADRNEWACSNVMALAIATSKVGTEVAYYLAEHPAESRVIEVLTPLEQARELGKIESKFDTPAKEEPTKPQPPKTTKAPPPPKHRAAGGGGKHQVPADTDDFTAFNEAYKKKPRAVM